MKKLTSILVSFLFLTSASILRAGHGNGSAGGGIGNGSSGEQGNGTSSVGTGKGSGSKGKGGHAETGRTPKGGQSHGITQSQARVKGSHSKSVPLVASGSAAQLLEADYGQKTEAQPQSSHGKQGHKGGKGKRGLERAIQAKQENPGKGAGKQHAIEVNEQNLQRQESHQ